MLTKETKEYFLQRLFEFLKIRSISSDLQFKSEITKAVNFLKKELRDAGFPKVEELYVKGLSLETNNPVIYAERLADPKAPTVLFYGHYDVQPPEPLELWITPPFEPVIRDGKIFARGASDDKGQIYTHLAALKLFDRNAPLNIKILIEGEEESGGRNLEQIILENPRKFRADVCVISDGEFIKKGQPSLEIGLRGIVYFEMEVITGDKDMHSGLYGGAVRNPLNIINRILSELEPKFASSKLVGVPENAKSSSFDVHGIIGGFQGEGSKTVIPNVARAKFSIRLTPAQNPLKVTKAVRSFVKFRTLKGVTINLKVLGTAEAFLATDTGKYMQIGKLALKKVFGRSPVLNRSGGSLPIISAISKKLGAEMVLMGYGLPDDNLHAPNEKLDLDQFYKGIECNLEFMRQLSNLN